MTSSGEFATALLLGVFGSTHCIGMCGGISGALAFALRDQATARRRLLLLVLYSVGRIAGYAALGAVVAGFVSLAPAHWRATAWPRVVAGILMLLMGINLGGWANTLGWLERMGGGVWKRVSRHLQRVSAVSNPWQAVCAGVVWGWLPCGLVYSTLAWTATTGSAERGAVLMLGFGIGTAPAVIASGALAMRLQSLLRRRMVRALAGAVVIAFGIWTLIGVMPGGVDHSAHAHHAH